MNVAREKVRRKGERREGEELLERSLRRCVAPVEKVENQLRLQLIDKKEEEKVFETALRSGLEVEWLIEAEEEEEERGRKSSVKGASERAFNEGGDLGKMEVQVRAMQGKIIRVCVKKETTVEELKELVRKKEGNPPDMQKIVFNNVQLSDMRTMSGWFIRNNEKLKLMQRLLAGCNGCSRADGADGADGERIEAWSENGNADGWDG
ncbi:putative Ubiquitin family [Monocercomonoides exilis]|uniref:putative Ubiquitin family n=1 Tax=Monocercomonoides exilis TaxID=2049356 RepID=UPI00355945D8|nr:putative Ubiquitin family [Monocercomonoides exilis]|eukprot:MONOS_11769.1-p1 / transcript=MONOS_11769.1 / gene=MONOS_11769 / organism=Monocercomonoides_exilis_PA203 / gene_product=unspecified product / transcript_product=unspecified product / location=Mono_scaffold00609:20558-21280(-) / protein_length=206 / sequence_SO=supercontig / SO=protein_coding / is_pseudo=false